MEDKLQLKHLACYLPYKLQLQQHAYGQDLITEMTCGNILNLLDNSTSYKPLLIPMGELTELEWIDVLEAGQPLGSGDLHKLGSGAAFYGNFGSQVSYSTRWAHFSAGSTFNQLAAFETLFSLHADVRGLIEKGLALNKIEHGR